MNVKVPNVESRNWRTERNVSSSTREHFNKTFPREHTKLSYTCQPGHNFDQGLASSAASVSLYIRVPLWMTLKANRKNGFWCHLILSPYSTLHDYQKKRKEGKTYHSCFELNSNKLHSPHCCSGPFILSFIPFMALTFYERYVKSPAHSGFYFFLLSVMSLTPMSLLLMELAVTLA